jgi:hypothetical protein
LPQPFLELPILELKSFKRGWNKLFYSWPPTFIAKSWRLNVIFLCFCWNFKICKKLQENISKHKNLKQRNINKQLERKIIQKHEIGKAWKLTSSCCVVCVPHLLLEQKHNEYICENLKQDIRVSNTPFWRNQAWKRNFKHKFVFFSHKKIFLFILVAYPKGHNSDPFKLFWELVTVSHNKLNLSWTFKTND